MRQNIITLSILGYGTRIRFVKNDKQANPKHKDYDSDGSIPKYKFYTNFNEFSNGSIVIGFWWNYRVVINILMNR